MLVVLLEPFFCGKLLLDLIWFQIKARWARSLRPDRHLLSTTRLRIRHFSINNQKIYINQHQLNININYAQFWRCMKITKFTLAKYHTSDGDLIRAGRGSKLSAVAGESNGMGAGTWGTCRNLAHPHQSRALAAYWKQRRCWCCPQWRTSSTM